MILEVQSNTQWLLPRSSDSKEGLEETVSFHKKEIIIFNFFLVNRVAFRWVYTGEKVLNLLEKKRHD